MDSKEKLSVLNISLTSGGAEKVISLLLKKLVEDYEVTLILFYNSIHFPIPEGVTTVCFKENPLKRPNPISKLYEFISFVFSYYRHLKKANISYAISFLAFPNLLNGVVSVFYPGPVTIISERGFPSDNTTSKFSLWVSKIFYPLLYNHCDKLFSNSQYINQDLKENFGIKIPMEVIYNPIEIPQLKKDPEDFRALTGPLKIINVGTLNERKNQALIIKALKKLSFPYKFKVLGAGHLKNKLKDLVHSLNISESVTFEGAVKNVGDYLLAHDLFVLSSNTEGFPNALLEAMSFGLPCISTNCLSGPLELLHDGSPINIANGDFFKGNYGILINNNDEIALVKAIEYLNKNPDKLVHYSKMSLLKSGDYGLDTIYAQFKAFIQK